MSNSREIILFYLEERTYAVPISDVRKIELASDITPLPEAPDIVAGIVNLKGDIVPVVNIKKRFNMKESGVRLTDYFIFGKKSVHNIALLVDKIGDIIEIRESDIVEREFILPELGFVEGALKLEGNIILIHDLEKCLTPGEKQSLEKAMQLKAGV